MKVIPGFLSATAMVMMVATLASCANAPGKTPLAFNHSEGYYANGRYYKFHGGWYALNQPYYWGMGPPVGGADPYDYNGHYFTPPLAQSAEIEFAK